MNIKKIGVIGAGAWGTALGKILAEKDYNVLLWAYEEKVAQAITNTHINPVYLPNIGLAHRLKATSSLEDFGDVDVLIGVTPAQHMREVTKDLSTQSQIKKGTPFVIAAKGIEASTQLLLSEVVAETLPQVDRYVLSGPTFADEVARGLPAAATLAGHDESKCKELAEMLSTSNFRPYVADDIIGTQIGGAIKNVIAIACGIVIGREIGENAVAGLLTRGLAEMTRLGIALGADPQTFMGLSGLGDLSLTCNGRQSRNMSLGIELGKGKDIDKILRARRTVTEGYHTAKVVHQIAKKHKIRMPIAESIYKILYEKAAIDDVMDELFFRPIKKEAA